MWYIIRRSGSTWAPRCAKTWTGGFMSFIFWLWLPLVGFPPAMIMTMQAISLLYQFWVHTELVRTISPLEWVMNMPSPHRVHHGSNQRYLDRNHAGVLIIWTASSASSSLKAKM